MTDENAAFCGEDRENGYRTAVLALLDAAEGKSLWNAALENDVPLETCIEMGTVFIAMMARKAGITPRQACDQLFKECPPDNVWQAAILPLMDGIAAGEGD